MRSLVVNTFLTLDGVMQGPGTPEEDPTGGFVQGGWSVHYWDEAMGQAMGETMSRPFELLLGRKTYEIFAAHWPYVSDEEREMRGGTPSEADDVAAGVLNTVKKYVASTTLRAVDWNNSTLIEGDVAEQVAKLRQGDGPELQVHGSWDLIQTLLEHDLIDEFRLWIFPVLVGNGKRLFANGTVPAGLRLVESRTFDTGVVRVTYARAGDIELGSFAFDNPTDEEVERRRHLGEGA